MQRFVLSPDKGEIYGRRYNIWLLGQRHRSMLVTNSMIDLHQALNNKGEALEVRGQIIRFEEGDFKKGK